MSGPRVPEGPQVAESFVERVRWPILSFAVVLGLVAAWADAAWLAADSGTQYTDAAFHWAQFVERWTVVAAGGEGFSTLLGTDERQRYGGLWYWFAAVLGQATGPEPRAILSALAVPLRVALAVAAADLGWSFGVPGRRALTAGLFAGSTLLLPGIQNYGRVFVLDLPLTVAVLAALAAWFRLLMPGAGPLLRVVAVSLTVVAAAIKLNALVFLVGPALVALRPRAGADRPRVSWRALVMAGVLGVLLPVILGGRLAHLGETFEDATWPGKALGYFRSGSAEHLLGDWGRSTRNQIWEIFYFSALQSLGVPWSAAGALGLGWIFARRHGCRGPLGREQRLALFLFMVPAAAFCAFLQRSLYDERYLLPILPAAALGVAATIADLPSRLLRVGAAVVALLGGTALAAHQHFDSFGLVEPLFCTRIEGPAGGERVGASIDLCALYPSPMFLDRSARPELDTSPATALERRLEHASTVLGRPLSTVFLDDLYGLFYLVHQRAWLAPTIGAMPTFSAADLLLVDRCWSDQAIRDGHGSVEALDQRILGADVVVLRYGARAGEDEILRGRRCLPFWSVRDSFVLAGDVALPDGTSARFFQRVR